MRTRRVPALSVEIKRDGEGRMAFEVRTPEGSITGLCRNAPMVEFTFDVGEKTARLGLDWPTAPNEKGDHYKVTPIGDCPLTPTRSVSTLMDVLERLNTVRACVIEAVRIGTWDVEHYQRWRSEHPEPQGPAPSGRSWALTDFERAFVEATRGVGHQMWDLL